MKRIFILVAGLLALSGPALSATPCDPPPGAAEIVQADTALVVVGEYHGTAETPAFFGDIVCLALASGKRVNVALEYPASRTQELRAFMQNERTETALLESTLGGLMDGRGSLAMVGLLDRLRTTTQAGGALVVTGIQPVEELEGSAYEEAMAREVLRSAQETHADLTLVLVGNVHAMRVPAPQSPDHRPMASFLPPDRVLTFNTIAYLGSAWGCRQGEEGQSRCQEWPLAQGDARPRAIWFSEEPNRIFDGRYSVGSSFTASPPAWRTSRGSEAAAHSLDDSPGYGQAQTRALGPVGRLVHAGELVEHPVQFHRPLHLPAGG